VGGGWVQSQIQRRAKGLATSFVVPWWALEPSKRLVFCPDHPRAPQHPPVGLSRWPALEMTGRRAAGVPGLAGPRHRHTGGGGVVLEKGTPGNAALPCWRYPLWLCVLERHICVRNCRFLCRDLCFAFQFPKETMESLSASCPVRAIRAGALAAKGCTKAQRCDILAKNALFIEYVGRCEAPGLAVGGGANDAFEKAERQSRGPRPVIPSLTANAAAYRRK
jgi:hypothetical protein